MRDPFEAAAARMAERREADGTDGPGGDGWSAGDRGSGGGTVGRVLRGDLRPKRNVLVKVGIGLVGLFTLATAALIRRPEAPDMPPDCTKPSFQLATPAKQHRPIAFTMVGPADRLYVLGVNTQTFRNEGGRWRAVPSVGRTQDDVVVVREEPMPECIRSGVLNIPLPLGTYPVTMYELTPSGATVVQRVNVEVVDAEEFDTVRRR